MSIFQPTEHLSEMGTILTIAGKRWVTASDIEAMTGINANTAGKLLAHLSRLKLLQRQEIAQRPCFGPPEGEGA